MANPRTARNPYGAGRTPTHDWALLLARFKADWEPHLLNMKDFCKSFDPPLNYNTAKSALIQEGKRTALEAVHARNPPLLLMAQARVSQALADQSRFQTPGGARAAEFALRTFETILEREEPNPTLAIQNNIVIPPLFAESEKSKAAMKALEAGE